MELKSTIDYMTSKDYKERFVAEYWQTKIRYEKLKNYNTKIEAAIVLYEESGGVNMEGEHYSLEDKIREVVGFVGSCPYELLKQQQSIMGEYLHTLELRAVIEGVDLNEY